MKVTNSLQKNKEFQRVYDFGKSYANKYLVMFVMPNGSERNRLGISVSKKVGNSVIRHQVKRRIKESYRLQEDKFISGIDIVIIARASAKDISYNQIESALMHLGRLQQVLSNPK